MATNQRTIHINRTTRPILSIIVAVYNVAPYLDVCIKSIVDQSFSDFELILVDDGSTDESPSICDKWSAIDARIQVIHQKNGGLSAARNAGINQSCGEFIGFVDGDDYISKSMYERLICSCISSKSDIACCGFYDQYTSICAEGACPQLNQVFRGEEVYRHSSAATASVGPKVFRRELWSNVRFPEGRLHEDDAVIYRLFISCERVRLLPERLYFYRHRSGSITSTITSKRLQDIDVNAEEQIQYVAIVAPHLISVARQNHVNALLGFAHLLISMPKKDYKLLKGVLYSFRYKTSRYKDLMSRSQRLICFFYRTKTLAIIRAWHTLHASHNKQNG